MVLGELGECHVTGTPVSPVKASLLLHPIDQDWMATETESGGIVERSYDRDEERHCLLRVLERMCVPGRPSVTHESGCRRPRWRIIHVAKAKSFLYVCLGKVSSLQNGARWYQDLGVQRTLTVK
jgi:hypothetical protein